MTNHHPWPLLISAYADGEATDLEAQQASSHLATCASCQDLYRGFLTVRSEVAGIALAPASDRHEARPQPAGWMMGAGIPLLLGALTMAVGVLVWQGSQRMEAVPEEAAPVVGADPGGRTTPKELIGVDLSLDRWIIRGRINTRVDEDETHVSISLRLINGEPRARTKPRVVLVDAEGGLVRADDDRLMYLWRNAAGLDPSQVPPRESIWILRHYRLSDWGAGHQLVIGDLVSIDLDTGLIIPHPDVVPPARPGLTEDPELRITIP